MWVAMHIPMTTTLANKFSELYSEVMNDAKNVCIFVFLGLFFLNSVFLGRTDVFGCPDLYIHRTRVLCSVCP